MTSASSPVQSPPIETRPAGLPEAQSGTCRSNGAVSPLEWIAASLVFAVLLYLRIRFNFVARFNSDEPQHLHVVWAWATGHLHYKEVFDNHMPLFQILMAPIFRLFGERAEVLIWMRFVMLPLFIASVWTVYKIGAIGFSQRAGLLASLLVAAWPRFFWKMCESRTDVLWTVFWLLAVLVAISGAPTWRRSLCVGLLLGAALGVSMKTTVLLAALAIGLGVTALFARQTGLTLGSRRTWQCLAAGVAGVCIIPGLLVAYFWMRDALPDMYYCVIAHNILPSPSSSHVLPGSALWGRIHHHFPLILGGGALLAFASRLVLGSASEPGAGLRRVFLMVVGAAYFILLFGTWPMVTPQDLLPSDANLAICVAPALLWVGDALARKSAFSAFIPVLFLAAEFYLMLGDTESWDDALMFKHAKLSEDSTTRKVNMVADVLKLTTPGQKIMDGKGETIFRPRGSYLVLETIMKKRLELNLRPDTLIEDMITARVPLIHDPGLMPVRDQEWVARNYVSIGTVEVLGKLLPLAKDGVIPFDVVIPETYTIVADHASFSGSLDGAAFTEPRYLKAGSHEFRPAVPNPDQKLVLCWARAVEKGYTPLFFLLSR